jgi:hypothetical protein
MKKLFVPNVSGDRWKMSVNSQEGDRNCSYASACGLGFTAVFPSSSYGHILVPKGLANTLRTQRLGQEELI